MIQESERKWYAIRTRSHFEQKVYAGLMGRSIQGFLPKVRVMSRRKDRRKKIEIPMLPGYVFAFSDLQPEEHVRILKTTGVVGIVGVKGAPVPANNGEISSLMILDGTDRTVQNSALMNNGDRVMIMEGPLKGLVGRYLEHKGQNDEVAVSIELLHRSLVVTIEDWALEKVSW